MRIGIDYTAALWQGAGIGRYTRELVRAVIAAAPQHQYTLFYAAGGLPAESPFRAEMARLITRYGVRQAGIPLSPRRLTQFWQRLQAPVPLETFTGPLDLVHAPDFVIPPTRARTLLTIHDLSFMTHPEVHVPSMVRYLTSAVPRSVRRADHLLADSEATSRDMQRLLGVEPAKITVVYPGGNPEFRPLPAAVCEPVRQKNRLPARYLLFVSTLSPRKNVVRLVEAYGQARASGAIPADIALVLVGAKGWLYDDVFATIERLGLTEQVRLPDYVGDNDLPALYNLALASVYPSVYEGFGLPALESLACGCPLLTADNSSLPEVAGDAAVMVDALSVTSIASGIARLVNDMALRERLRHAGPRQAARFQWETAAQQVLAEYRRLAG